MKLFVDWYLKVMDYGVSLTLHLYVNIQNSCTMGFTVFETAHSLATESIEGTRCRSYLRL